MQRQSDIEAFYMLLEKLENRMGGRRRLADCHGRMQWPNRGVYFFFEPAEYRADIMTASRVVRIGTHALKSGSRTTVWKRLSQHRGTLKPFGGNHRGSIFRLLVGQALMTRNPSLAIGSWEDKRLSSMDVGEVERPLEQAVSKFLAETTLLVLPILDGAEPDSLRGLIERNSIALLSSSTTDSVDKPSADWLGSYSNREKVLKSGLWNNNHVDETYDPDFLNVMESLVSNSFV